MRVRIKRLPQARTGYQVQGALVNDVPAMGGVDYNAYIGQERPKVGNTISKVPRSKANLEAEGGETVIGNIDGSGMPSFYTITGPRHSEGGVPLNLPDDSFIYSDTQSMKISDPTILKMFNKPAKKGGYTPAELSKPYDLNKFRKILQDPESDEIARNTAELMIKNYTIKLGALALAQEAKKGFPQGIPEVAKPYMDANNISPEQIMPELAAQKQQAQEQAPEDAGQEPNIEPQAEEDMAVMNPGMSADQMGMPQQDMMMQMGGMLEQDYMFPYYPTEMAYGGYLPKAPDGVTVEGIGASKVSKAPTDQGWKQGKVSGGSDKTTGYYRSSRGQGEKVSWHSGKGNASEASVASGVCKKIAKSGDIEDAILGAFPAYLKGKRKGDPGYEEAMQAAVARLSANPLYADCIKKANEKFEKKEAVYLEPEDTGIDECECTDEATMEKFTVGKDENDNCLPCTSTKKRCECPDGSDPGMDEDGNCNDCETEEEEGAITTPPKPEAQWWLQDTVNTMGAFGELMGVKKYMPWEARVDLEEPRPTFLDPTRELVAQSEQANIAAQASAQFAGPQALGVRLSAIQGQGAASAANTLSNINNQNVNIANQFEANQVGVRNQEQMLNQQMANRVYDKNVIANQQYDNAIRQGRANLRQAYNTAVTNKWKTDALNQLYPNYQTLAGPGGKVIYTPTEKQLTPEKPGATEAEYYKELLASGLPDDVAGKLVIDKFKSKKGGNVQRGYIYTDWPIFL
jgi:hypothetical protein